MFQDASTQTEPPKDASTQTDSRPGSPQPASNPESPDVSRGPSRAASPEPGHQMDPFPSEDEWPPMFPCPLELRPGSPHESPSDSDDAAEPEDGSSEPLIEGHQMDQCPSEDEWPPIEGHQTPSHSDDAAEPEPGSPESPIYPETPPESTWASAEPSDSPCY